MIIKESLKYKGKFKIFEIDIKLKKMKKIAEFDNLVTNDGLDEIVSKFLPNSIGYDNGLEVKYLALGDNSTPVTGTDPKLTSEQYRTIPIDSFATTTGVVYFDFYLTSGECNTFTIEELGIYISNLATPVVDTGVLLSHVLYHYVKNSSVEILVRYTITLA
jgi:hypothetical protein